MKNRLRAAKRWSIIAMLGCFVFLLFASQCNGQEPVGNGIFDRFSDRFSELFQKNEKAIEAHEKAMEGFVRDWLNRNDTAIEKQEQVMRGFISDWRKERSEYRKERLEVAAEERRLRREQFEFERDKRREEWNARKKEISEQAGEITKRFTPVQGLIERLENALVSLRSMVWQLALTIGVVVFLALVLFAGIRWAWDKFLSNVIGYPFAWIISKITGLGNS